MDPNLEFFWPRTSIENYLQLLDCVRDLNDEEMIYMIKFQKENENSQN